MISDFSALVEKKNENTEINKYNLIYHTTVTLPNHYFMNYSKNACKN